MSGSNHGSSSDDHVLEILAAASGNEPAAEDSNHAEDDDEDDDEDDEDEDEDNEESTRRADVARGLIRMSSAPIALRTGVDAPPFVIAFELVEFTSLPHLLLDLIGAVTNIKSIIEKGERGAFIQGLHGFQVCAEGQFGKSIIYRKANDGLLEQLSEINLQIRIQEMIGVLEKPGADANENEGRLLLRQHFVLLIAESPLPFSIRKAAHITTRSVGRLIGLDARGADLRRKIWAQAAMHVREEFEPRLSSAALLMQYCQTMDWMNNTGPDGFTALFSMQRALDWMKLRFLRKHAPTRRRHAGYAFASPLRIQGVADTLSPCLLPPLPAAAAAAGGAAGGEVRDWFVDPQFCDECRSYDVDVDREIERSNPTKKKKPGDNNKKKKPQKKKKAPPKRRRKGQPESPPPPADEEEDEDDDNNEEAEEEEAVRVIPYAGVKLDGQQQQGGGQDRRGLPFCAAAMRVILQTTVEKPMGILEVRQHLRTLPESVMLLLLNAHMRLMGAAADDNHNNARQQRGGGSRKKKDHERLSLADMRELVIGDGEYTLGRPMLSNGDALWGEQMMAAISAAPAAGGAGGAGGAADAGAGGADDEALETMRRFVSMGFALAFTRAQGSDGYFNGRVATYGRAMFFDEGQLSRRECRAAYVLALHQAEEQEHHQNPTDGALRFCLNTLVACDDAGWHLRPDNLFLLLQLLISDIMLALNYHDAVVGGASNGIGATVIVRDGGGSYRRKFKDPGSGGLLLGQIYSKTYSTGADTCVNAVKKAMNAGSYDPRFPFPQMPFEELKRVTETSLIHNSCMVLERREGVVITKHVIENADKRYYSTEMKAGCDQQSQSNMMAISWLIPRNTSGPDNNRFITTREDPNSKERICVEFQQVIGGYWVLCSNAVGERERFKTIAAVSRTVTSSANGLGMEDVLRCTQSEAALKANLQREERCNAQNGTVDQTVGSSHEEALLVAGRPLFFTGIATVFYAAFMQWTGMLGRIRETRRAEAILRIFYAQLELCRDLLNPDMASRGDKGRFLHVSKARSIAVGLLAIGMRETLVAGRNDERQQPAVERAAAAFKAEGGAPAVSWVVADTLEHMFRLDFMLLMTMLGRHFRAPRVDLDALLEWLRTGAPDACPAAEAFYQEHLTAHERHTAQEREERGLGFVESAMSMGDGRRLLPCCHCLYLSAPELRVATRPETWSSNEGFARFCHGAAVELHRLFWKPLHEFCQIDPSEDGTEVVRGMLVSSVNQPFAWPSILGSAETLGAFWKDRAPPDLPAGQVHSNASLLRDLARLTLPPLRVLGMEVQRARLGVDLRWLLLMNALSHGLLAQSARFSAVAQLTQHFFKHCVPNELMPARYLFTGLPSQVTGTGFLWPPALVSERRTLRRPGYRVGMDGFSASRMVEDMGTAAPRYELANLLGVSERDLPTSCVEYELPYDVVIPVLFFDTQSQPEDVDRHGGEPGALRWKPDGRVHLFGRGHPAAGTDISLSGAEMRYFGGRSAIPIRPTCSFARPGVLVRANKRLLGVVVGFLRTRGRYRIQTNLSEDGSDDDSVWRVIERTPYQVEDALVLQGTVLRVALCGLLPLPGVAVVELSTADGRVTHRVHAAPREEQDNNEDEEELSLELVGLLEYQRVDGLPVKCIAIRMNRAADNGAKNGDDGFLDAASHGHTARAHLDDRLAPCLFVRIDALIGELIVADPDVTRLTHCRLIDHDDDSGSSSGGGAAAAE